VLAAALFGFAGPVIHVGHAATNDAVVVLLLTLLLRVAVSVTRNREGVALAVALTALAAVDLTVLSLVVPVALIAVAGWWARRWRGRQAPDAGRAPSVHQASTRVAGWPVLVLAGGGLVAVVALGSWLLGDAAADVLRTPGSSAGESAPRAELLGDLVTYGWPVVLGGLVGAGLLVRERGGAVVPLVLGLMSAGLALPLAGLVDGRVTAFHEHLAWSALFLAPLGGVALQRAWSYSYSLVVTPLVLSLLVVFLVGAFRAHDLDEFPDVRPVVSDTDLAPGEYLSSSHDAMAYYTLDDDAVRWTGSTDLLAGGRWEMDIAVKEQRYAAVFLHVGADANVLEQRGYPELVEALEASGYAPSHLGDDDEWLVYTRP
jgi:hypothetical protein